MRRSAIAPRSGGVRRAWRFVGCCLREWGRDYPQIKHAILPHIRHGAWILNAAKAPQRKRDAASRFEYLARGVANIGAPRLLDDHLGVDHERCEAVADFVNGRECRVSASGEPRIVRVSAIRRIMCRNTFDLGDQIGWLAAKASGCGHGDADPDILAVFSNKPLDELVASNVCRYEPTSLFGFGLEIVGMGDVARVEVLELTAGKAKHLAQRPIRLYDGPIRGDKRHRMWCVLERIRKKRIAVRPQQCESDWLLWAKSGQTSLPSVVTAIGIGSR